jgi:hypothetical protein
MPTIITAEFATDEAAQAAFVGLYPNGQTIAGKSAVFETDVEADNWFVDALEDELKEEYGAQKVEITEREDINI